MLEPIVSQTTYVRNKNIKNVLTVPDTNEGAIITSTFLWLIWWLIKKLYRFKHMDVKVSSSVAV